MQVLRFYHLSRQSCRLAASKFKNNSLMPPDRLFRGILRAHRALPSDMRSLGDLYVKSGEILKIIQ